MRERKRRREEGFSALENGWVGPSAQERIRLKGKALIAKGDIDKAKGMAIALGILRGTGSRAEWEDMQ